MEIKVQNKIQDNKVTFISDFGEGVGTWMDEEPDPGRKYTVEVTIPEKITTEFIHESEEKHCLIEMDEESKIHIVGQLEDYEEDGFAVLRLEESIICFDTDFDEQIEHLHGKFIDVMVSEIRLNSVGI
ncbi:hypothetical protein [Listeria fleischmannii]|uniref:Uncharacterized protein n=2 Tax=Listeria fleischmannii TaxID=1069827 RepID=W7DKN3_9LIST|nr:hypothetical protein [Listeria fleischmannii]EUJ52539.1 hypothetical protein MCOL2_13122 [Listeria fleischmannii FSL S10-1203]MBC1397827.1 hypothetical protein [Listeria fleischmannii]MBC1417522.1 hypothetical protein [Listeria fleischmannii]MBC1427408.1 hypothetical protein [Listeria fleischmannii]